MESTPTRAPLGARVIGEIPVERGEKGEERFPIDLRDCSEAVRSVKLPLGKGLRGP
jgi:hypothetical protein